jgi:AcrR family transcriptional regulator
MSTGKRAARTYSSPLRERQQEETRGQILGAAAEIVSGGALHSFSMQDVAERAGISYASVYRHFPTRERLLEAIYDWAGEQASAQMPSPPAALSEVPRWIGESISVFEQHPEAARALVAIGAALNVAPASRGQRDQMVQKLVAAGAPGLPRVQQRRAAAIIRHLASSQSWAMLRHRFGLSAADTAGALTWALDVLVRELQGHAADSDETRSSESTP